MSGWIGYERYADLPSSGWGVLGPITIREAKPLRDRPAVSTLRDVGRRRWANGMLNMRASLVAVALALFLEATTAAASRAAVVEMVSFNGKTTLRIDRGGDDFCVAGPAPASPCSDSGGGYVRDCSAGRFRCIDLGGIALAVPTSTRLPPTWVVHGDSFAVVGRADRGADAVWLIEASRRGDAYIEFSYSRARGIESVSLHSQGQPSWVAVTYFTVGNKGLLAR
jgi:hypothetical protein